MGNFTRDDVYNIIVPVVLVVIGWIAQYLSWIFKTERQWKNAR